MTTFSMPTSRQARQEWTQSMLREEMKTQYATEDRDPDPGIVPYYRDPLAVAIESNEVMAETLLKATPPPGSASGFLGKSYANKFKADKLMKAKDTRQARKHYVEAVDVLCGTMPYREQFFCERYMKLTLPALACELPLACIGAARCMFEHGDFELALHYVSQLEVLHRHAQLQDKSHTFEWMDYVLRIPDFYRVRILCSELTAEIFTSIGNTGAANESSWKSTTLYASLSSSMKAELMKSMAEPKAYHHIETRRHPDPNLIHKQKIDFPKLQIRGSWEKMNTRGLSGRTCSSSFVYEGHIYVFGGEKCTDGPYFPELWRLNVTRMGEWERLPAYAYAGRPLPDYTGFQMVVDPATSRAYLFFGKLEVHFYDLKRSSWGIVNTTFTGPIPWPYELRTRNYAINLVAGKIYVFGGLNSASCVGTDVFMVLDIATREWTYLSGEAFPTNANLLSPGPREHACSWVGKGGKKIYIMYGDADRLSAKMAGGPHGSMTMYDYEDLWAWDIEKKTWTRERIIGNKPSRRTEMACVYNPVLDKVLTFGGFSPRVPTSVLETKDIFSFSYYADTFMLDSDDPSTSSWKHVLTRGFPIYRAQARLLVDEATGKTYLFSGYTNSEYIPGHKHKKLDSRSYADVWQLKLNMEGGCFESVDIEEEAKTARAGPWQRCFACGSAGRWKKCGGSCHGKVHFCNAQCLRDGWKEHRESHSCRKV